jgi:uncharacterized Zn finger protein
MIELTSVEQMRTAIQRAKDVRPVVRLTSIYRQYIVENRAKKTRYYVNFFVEGGKRYAGCQCKAGKHNMLCYHIAAASAVHLAIARQRKSH